MVGRLLAALLELASLYHWNYAYLDESAVDYKAKYEELRRKMYDPAPMGSASEPGPAPEGMSRDQARTASCRCHHNMLK